MTSKPPVADDQEVLVVEVSTWQLAIRLEDVREIVGAVRITPLPDSKAPVVGFIDVRGEEIPVLSVRSRWGLPEQRIRLSDAFVLVASGDVTAALHVDQALGTSRVSTDEIELARKDLTGADHPAGVVKLGSGLIVIHDLARFLSLEEAGQYSETRAGHGTSEGH
jgi:purine-binding chemotaxis protein CheW